MKEDSMYLNELFLLSLVYRLNVVTSGPVNQKQVNDRYNILSYKFRKMMKKLMDTGLVNNEMKGPRGHFKPLQLVVSPLGEQLLIKYDKALRRLCEEV
jgi:hypothetical protein